METTVSVIVRWVIVPCVMLALFIFALRIAARAGDPELRRSAWAGIWAGLVILVLYIVSQSSRMRSPDLDFSTLPGLQTLPLLIGLAAGFVFLGVVRFLVPTRVVGLVTLLLSATSSCALFSYVFIDSLRLSVLYASLGAALGILLHIVVFPASVKGTSD
jgi:hypothetical protein